MALNNFTNIITDKYTPDSVDDLFDQYGVEGFSGTDASLISMNAPAWLFSIAVKTIIDGGDEDKILKSLNNILSNEDKNGIKLYKENNSLSQNILMQALLYFRNTDYKADDIINYYNKIGGVNTSEALKEIDNNKFSATSIVMSEIKYIKDLDTEESVKTYKEAFLDKTYDSTYPASLLIYKTIFNDDLNNKALDIINTLKGDDSTGRFGSHDSIFTPLPKSNSMPFTEGMCKIINTIPNETMDNSLKEDAFLYKIIESMYNKIDTTSTPIVESIDFDKCTGFTYLETGFSLSTYKNKSADYEPIFGIMTTYLNKRGASLNTDIVKLYIDKGFVNPFTFPYIDSNISGITILGQLSDSWRFSSEDSTLSDLLVSLFKQVDSDIDFNDDDSNYQKTVKVNAVVGSVAEFSEGANINMYGPLNILFNKINLKHKNWCNDNDKKFDDYDTDDGYTADRDKVIGLDYIDFDSYKKWCQNFGKDF